MTMRAYARTEARSNTVELLELPIPAVGDHELLVEIRAFGVGIHDRTFIPQNGPFPYAIGTEGAGVVTQRGSNVRDYQVGERVVLSVGMAPKGGPWAEFAVVPAQALFRLPEGMSFAQGAAIPIAGKAALESMGALDLERGQTLFVAGASGAIGTLVVQLAVARGIRVAASASPKNHEYLLSLGALRAVDYADPAWQEQVRAWSGGGVDGALAIQPGTGQESVEVVRDGGKVVTVSGDRLRPTRGIEVQQIMHQEKTRSQLLQLVADIVAGRIQLVIERVYPFAQALDALEKTETRHARGKVVVSLESEG